MRRSHALTDFDFGNDYEFISIEYIFVGTKPFGESQNKTMRTYAQSGLYYIIVEVHDSQQCYSNTCVIAGIGCEVFSSNVRKGLLTGTTHGEWRLCMGHCQLVRTWNSPSPSPQLAILRPLHPMCNLTIHLPSWSSDGSPL